MSSNILKNEIPLFLKGKFISFDKVDDQGRFLFTILGESRHEFLIVSSYWEWRSYGEVCNDAVDFSPMGFNLMLSKYDAGMRTVTEVSYPSDNSLIIKMRGKVALAVVNLTRCVPEFKGSKSPKWQIKKDGEIICDETSAY